jgi:hypothetical protein
MRNNDTMNTQNPIDTGCIRGHFVRPESNKAYLDSTNIEALLASLDYLLNHEDEVIGDWWHELSPEQQRSMVEGEEGSDQ